MRISYHFVEIWPSRNELTKRFFYHFVVFSSAKKNISGDWWTTENPRRWRIQLFNSTWSKTSCRVRTYFCVFIFVNFFPVFSNSNWTQVFPLFLSYEFWILLTCLQFFICKRLGISNCTEDVALRFWLVKAMRVKTWSGSYALLTLKERKDLRRR